MAENLTIEPLLRVSRVAGTNLTGSRFVTMSSGKAVVCGLNGQAFGVLEDDILAGQHASIIASGFAIVEVGSGGVTENAHVTSDAAGKAIAAAAISATATLANAVIPSGATPVTSSGAQPTLTITQPTITMAGGSPAVKINGIAQATVAENGFVLVKLI
jgi:hypothetical protein